MLTDYAFTHRGTTAKRQTMIHDDRCEDASRVAVGIGWTSDGRHPRPTHRVNQKSQDTAAGRRREATCGNDDVRHWEAVGLSERSSQAVAASRPPSPVAPRGPLAFRLALRRTRGPLTSFPLARVAAPSSMRGSGATHTGADVRKRKSKHDSRHTGRLDCRFTTHLVDRHKTACRITHALNK
jgi:hypothetical protein